MQIKMQLQHGSAEMTSSIPPTNQLEISVSKMSNPCQPSVACFPKTLYGQQCRSFQPQWYVKYPWIEYSIKHDTAFCFCCRWFRPSASSTGGGSETFVTLGFKNWQKAIQPGRGLEGHNQSAQHKMSLQSWEMWKHGQHSSTSIAHQLSQSQLGQNRKYLAHIANLIRFLATNEKPLRGTVEEPGSDTGGFFLAMLDRDLANDKELKAAAESVPKNCRYTSPEAQNDIIDLWFELLQEQIIARVSGSMFCVMADETRNKNNVEDLCVCIRHLDANFAAHEYILDISALKSLNADEISNEMLKVLENTVGTDDLVAQSYDGASVMSGSKGGVQKVLSDLIGRKLVYIHCFAHRLHLVVLQVIQVSKHVQWVFEVCQGLYNFFRRYTVSEKFRELQGHALTRILEQRWSGHHDSLNTVISEIDNIMRTLNIIAAGRTSEAAAAAGLLSQLKNSDFLPVAHVGGDVDAIKQRISDRTN